MRHRLAIVAALLTALGCDSPSVPDVALAPAHGGTVAELDACAVELVVHATGELEVFVRRGTLDAASGLTVVLPDDEGTPHAVALQRVDDAFVGALVPALGRGDAELVQVREGRRTRVRVPIPEPLPAAEHGGAVLRVGDRVMEVVVEPTGAARVHVRGEPARELDLTLVLPGEARHPLALAWSDTASCYVGRLEGATLRAGRLDLLWVDGDRTHVGSAVRAAPRPLFDAPSPDGFQLELPELGSDLPAVIAIPPPDEPIDPSDDP